MGGGGGGGGGRGRGRDHAHKYEMLLFQIIFFKTSFISLSSEI